MGVISWPSIGFYCLFSVFVYYQQMHGRDYRGASAAFGTVLNLYGFAGMLIGFAYLIYYGWTVAWWVPILAFVIGVLAILPASILERLVGKLALSLAGFVVWPFAAYMMFHYVPN